MNDGPVLVPPHIDGLDYRQPLGSGGYSEVYLYEQQRPRMNVAVKVLNGGDIDDSARRQFTAEGDAMAALADHPFIVQVFRADITADGRPYLVMKYYPQPNLGQRARRERLSVAEALRVGIQISSAVETAHRVGILHRDIKPANILTGQYGNPGLTDFGIAATTTDAVRADGLSVPWSPPEVLYSSAAPDVRSDVYSLSATIWTLLTGRSPFADPGGDNRAVALMRRIMESPPRPTGRADVPESLDRLLALAMAKQPAARASSALTFALGLQRIEQELRLPLTQIVVPADPSATRSRTNDARDFDATRIKVPRPIAAQGPAPAAPVLGGVAPGGLPDPVAPGRRRSRVPFAIAAMVVAVAAAVFVGLQLRGNDGASAPPTTNPPGTTEIAVPTAPPGTPVVAVATTGTNAVQVRFTWTYEASLASDSYRWRTPGEAGGLHVVKTPRLTLPRGDAQRTCIQVQVFRVDGSASSAWSTSTCSP